MEQLEFEDFVKNRNTKFKIFRTGEEVFEAELAGVAELRSDDVLNTFAIEFSLPNEFGYEQKIYRIEHAELGTMELFLVPAGQTKEGIRFEAIFNLLVRK